MIATCYYGGQLQATKISMVTRSTEVVDTVTAGGRSCALAFTRSIGGIDLMACPVHVEEQAP